MVPAWWRGFEKGFVSGLRFSDAANATSKPGRLQPLGKRIR